ncbi:DUF2628 domain-containing protein [Citrobacter amalonaticus]|uniref:DUF2628 domain-containing protein n=1 Tax=Citrobacter amalonaticus TaxID=35703 RepID=UPI00207CA16F|nr:DUF2628 domain-containing protein [Citrobacter amalonaticus]MCO4161401.1 DUF2628 domain-containing protein [Citrobacter amalonaticus]MCR9030314.1 DUF2628 domain-containing protein [Citrobacter amalonaticus]
MEKHEEKIGELSEKWQARFAFYDQYGLPGFWKTPPLYASGYKTLSFSQRMNMGFNVWAFVFSFIYLFYLGLWKKGITVLLLFLAVGAISIAYDVSIIGYAISALVGFRANIWFYLLKVKNEQTWGL